jgi:DNA-directed RNA polymerase specialized sigma24 family protein
MALRVRSPDRPDLADDLIAATWHHIARIQHGDLECHTADYILRSARRDVFYRRSQRRRELLTPAEAGIADGQSRVLTVESADPASESMAKLVLDRAQLEGRITASARTIVWLRDVLGHDMATSAEAAGRPLSSAYRLRQQAHQSLRLLLSECRSGEAGAGHGAVAMT